MRSDFDIGPLTWVKGEIDLALQRADEALKAFELNPQDDTRLKFAMTHLHQAHGALSVVGLDGIAQFTEAIEQLLAAVEIEKPPHSSSAAATAAEAIVAIRHYLDDLVVGMPNQPLRLFPHYRALATARGGSDVSPSELFFFRILASDRRDASGNHLLAATDRPSKRSGGRGLRTNAASLNG